MDNARVIVAKRSLGLPTRENPEGNQPDAPYLTYIGKMLYLVTHDLRQRLIFAS